MAGATAKLSRQSTISGSPISAPCFTTPKKAPAKTSWPRVNAVRRRGIVDNSRIAVCGWSYGGIMTAWMISKYHIWRAAVSGASVNDWITDYGTADDSLADVGSFSRLAVRRRQRSPSGDELLLSPTSPTLRRRCSFSPTSATIVTRSRPRRCTGAHCATITRMRRCASGRSTATFPRPGSDRATSTITGSTT